jgi:hypothetical protein
MEKHSIVKTIYPITECDTLPGIDPLAEDGAMPRPKSTTPTRFVGFRLPESLYDALADLAKRETRSINAQLVVILRDALQVDERDTASPEAGGAKKKRVNG